MLVGGAWARLVGRVVCARAPSLTSVRDPRVAARGPKKPSRQRGAPAPRFQRFLGSSTFPRYGNIPWSFAVFAAVGAHEGPHPAYNAAPTRATPFERRHAKPKEGPVKEGIVEDEEQDEELAEEGEFPEDLAEAEDEDEVAAAPPEAPGEAGEASLDEILTSRPEEAAAEEEDDESVLAFDRDERIETLSVKVVPQQPTEFTCRKCYLVKHRSQLADKKRMLCRDCA